MPVPDLFFSKVAGAAQKKDTLTLVLSGEICKIFRTSAVL